MDSMDEVNAVELDENAMTAETPIKRHGGHVSLGSVVLYTPFGPRMVSQPAIVCKLLDVHGGVHLHVFPSGSSYLATDIQYSERQHPNTWRWPDPTCTAEKQFSQ